jgi:hypothetical protein
MWRLSISIFPAELDSNFDLIVSPCCQSLFFELTFFSLGLESSLTLVPHRQLAVTQSPGATGFQLASDDRLFRSPASHPLQPVQCRLMFLSSSRMSSPPPAQPLMHTAIPTTAAAPLHTTLTSTTLLA